MKTKIPDLSKIYGTKSPAKIQRYLIWNYVNILCNELLTPGQRPFLNIHRKHFDLTKHLKRNHSRH